MIQESITQAFTHLSNGKSNSIRCHYVNNSSHIHVIKLMGVPNCYLERTVFPGQQLLFEAPLESYLEVFTGEIVQAIVKDRIPCRSLCIQQSKTI